MKPTLSPSIRTAVFGLFVFSAPLVANAAPPSPTWPTVSSAQMNQLQGVISTLGNFEATAQQAADCGYRSLEWLGDFKVANITQISNLSHAFMTDQQIMSPKVQSFISSAMSRADAAGNWASTQCSNDQFGALPVADQFALRGAQFLNSQ